MDEIKPFKIPKREVWEAFKRVKPCKYPTCSHNSVCEVANVTQLIPSPNSADAFATLEKSI